MVEHEVVDGRVALAVELGLTFGAFGTRRWLPPSAATEFDQGPPRGRWVLEQRLYWLTADGLFHSGPFPSLEAGLLFLVKRYGRALD